MPTHVPICPPTQLRIAVIGPSRTPVAEPFDGGLAAHVWSLCHALIRRGHDVTLFAPPASDPRLPVRELELGPIELSEDARNDVSMPPELMLREHHAYLRVMLELAAKPARYDVVHNHSTHYLPLAMAGALDVPMVTTLHTPPTAWLESAVHAADPHTRRAVRYVTVSAHTAGRWRPLVGDVGVVHNGIDLHRWRPGPGGADLVWTGRLVPEKAPHLAIAAARLAGRRIVLAGPIDDRAYFKADVEPLLGPDAVHVGHLDQVALSRLVGMSAVAVATPVWNEPYGLVIAEALASGTPVAGFGRGGVPEVVDDTCARLVDAGDVPALAGAIDAAAGLSRPAARARAEQNCGLDTMIDGYLTEYAALAAAHRP